MAGFTVVENFSQEWVSRFNGFCIPETVFERNYTRNIYGVIISLFAANPESYRKFKKERIQIY